MARRLDGDTLDVMQYKLYHYIMQPALVVTVAAGSDADARIGAATDAHQTHPCGRLVLYHLQCGRIITQLELDESTRSHTFFRWFNEIPTLILIAIVYLVIQQPG